MDQTWTKSSCRDLVLHQSLASEGQKKVQKRDTNEGKTRYARAVGVARNTSGPDERVRPDRSTRAGDAQKTSQTTHVDVARPSLRRSSCLLMGLSGGKVVFRCHRDLQRAGRRHRLRRW
uniref:Uncharacterized protein n=1 Tax=Plectus sambesii TaxID=2011161 RepID=A0A914WMC9_9BILA